MKVATILAMLTLSLSALAQPPELSEEQMQRMMQSANEMQACFAQVDQSALEELGKKAEQLETQINSLCASGKRSEAERVALKFGMEMANSEEMKALRKCGEMVRQMMPPMLFKTDPEYREDRHICDNG